MEEGWVEGLIFVVESFRIKFGDCFRKIEYLLVVSIKVGTGWEEFR